MQRKTGFLAIAAGLALTACGGGGGGFGGGNGGVPGASLGEVYRTAPTGSLIIDIDAIDQALRGNPDFSASTAQGATGVMATATQFNSQAPQLRDVRLSLNADRSILTVQVEGWPTAQLPVDGSASKYSGTWGEFFGGIFVSLSHLEDTGTIDYTDSRNVMAVVSGDGFYGLETPLDRLPTSSTPVNYSGSFETIGHQSGFSVPAGWSTDGTFTMALNFDTGSIGGTTAGRIFYWDGSTLQQDNGATGTVSGVIVGNGIGGTFTLVGSASSATHTYEGNLYGWDATEIGGGVVGSVSGPGGTGGIYGAFEGQLD